MTSTAGTSDPWYRRSGWILVLLLLCFPVGLYFMWRGAAWSRGAKWAVTGLWALLVVLLIVAAASAPPTTSTAVTSTTSPAPTIAAAALSTSAPTFSIETPVPTQAEPAVTAAPTPAPTAAPQGQANLPEVSSAQPSGSCSASMSNPSPGTGGSETAHITSNLRNSAVTLTAHYKSKDSTYTSQTNGSGAADITFGIGHPTSGYTVTVDIDIAGHAQCSTSFTPQ